MTRLIFVAEIQSPEFEPEMTLDGQAQEFTKNMAIDLINRSTIEYGFVKKIGDNDHFVAQDDLSGK